MQQLGIRVKDKTKDNVKAQEGQDHGIKDLLPLHLLRGDAVKDQKDKGKAPLYNNCRYDKQMTLGAFNTDVNVFFIKPKQTNISSTRTNTT